MANEKQIKAKVIIDSNEAQEELSKLIENFKKSNAALRATNPGSGLSKSMKDLTISFSDILTKSGTIRKKLPEDFKLVEKRFGDLSKYLVDNIKTTSQKASNEITTITKSIVENIDKTAKSVGKTLDNEVKSGGIGQFFDSLRYRAGVFVSYRAISGVAEGFNTVAKSTVELQSRFANIQAITSATDTDMEKLRNTILKVGEASKFSVEDIAEATTQLGQAGLTANEINDVLETTTQLAAATGSNLSNTIDLMTSSLAVWGLNSEEASHLSDVMVTGMNRTKATLDTFRMAVQYAGATMASLNVSFDEFASVASSAANAGIRASVIGTGLRAMTAELISPTKKMVRGLADLGLTTDDVNIASKGLVNVLQTLKDAGLNASNAYDLFGKRAAQFVLAAEGQLDVTTQLQIALAESGATLKAYGIQIDTVAAQWTAMANTVKEAAYGITQSTRGFIHDTLVSIRNFIKFTMEDSVDELNEVTGEFKNNVKSVESYQKVLQQINSRDYRNNESQAIKDTNDLIESVNKLFHKNIDLVKSTEDLAEARKKAADALREEKQAQIESYNSNIQQTRNTIMSQGFMTFMDERGGYSTGAKGFQTRNSFMKEWTDKFKDQVLEFENLIKENDTNYGKIQSEIKQMKKGFERTFLESAFESASDLVVRVKDEKIDVDKLNRDTGLYNVYEKLINSINTNLTQILVSDGGDIDKIVAEKVEGVDYTISKSISDAYDSKQEYINSLFSQISESTVDTEMKQQLLDKLSSVDSTLKNRYTGLLDQLINLFQTEGDLNKVNAFQKLRRETQNLTLIEQRIEDSKRKKQEEEEIKRRQRESSRTAKEAERERARRFNQKYQRFSLQTQADSYAQDIAEAQRKGVISKLQTQETTGDLSSYYSTVAADLSKLESLKTALANKKTFEAYQKDYGEIFKQVRDGQVTLEDAEYKTDGVISKMIELDKNIKSAEAEFGDLNSIDLSDIDSQITTLNEKLKVIGESGENEFSKLKMGFAATVESMSKSYSSAKIGSTIAEDFGNGMSDALYSVADGTKSMKEAFSDMARSILQDISKMLIKMSVLKAMEMGVGMFFGGGEQPVVAGGESGTGAIYGGVYGNGGFVPKLRAAAGKLVRGGIQGRDSVPAMVMPGEYILKKSAVDALGTNFLNDLNNNAAQTLAGTAASLAVQNPWEESSDSEPAVVNVWVVSKEEEAQMGPNDIIATIGKDIMTGGQTRRLIQSVVAGRK